MVKVASYLYLRNEIYYFQVRIPRDKQDATSKFGKLIRKSTGTSNQRAAAMIARKWINEIMDSKLKNPSSDANTATLLDEIDRNADENGALYREGKYHFEKLDAIDENDTLTKEEFFRGLSERQDKALKYYIDFKNNNNPPAKKIAAVASANTAMPVTKKDTKTGRKLGYKEKCGIKKLDGEKKDFHSFRHTLINQAKQQRLDDGIIRQITGHSSANKDVHAKIYQSDFGLDLCVKEISKIKFNINFDVIKKWPKF